MAELARLRARLRELGSVVVAFSGGADSAFLAWVAVDTLGPDAVLCVTAVSPSLADEARDDCAALAREWSLPWIEVETDEMDLDAYRRNDGDRCYWCKSSLMDVVAPIAEERSASVVLGVNVDDLGDHRPGQRAAAERGARFPMVDAGFSKADVRTWSRTIGLRTSDKPAAPCLASRVPYGTAVTVEVLGRVERAERALHALGYADVRVRHYGDRARVEIAGVDLARALADPEPITAAVRGAGYPSVEIDRAGLRSGNLNLALRAN